MFKANNDIMFRQYKWSLAEKMLLSLFVLFTFTHCADKQEESVALQVGQYKMSKIEYARFRTKNVERAGMADSSIRKLALDEAYIHADAISKGFDTLDFLKKKLFYGQRLFSSETGGYVWRKKTEPLLRAAAGDSLGKANASPGVRYQELAKKHVLNRRNDVLKRTEPLMHNATIDKLAACYDPYKKEWPGINTGEVLMEYCFNHLKHFYRVKDFIEFVHCEPVFFGSLSSSSDVKEMLVSYLADVVLFADALEMGMAKDRDFLVFSALFRHKLYVQHYYEHYIYADINITPEAVRAYYQHHLENFTIPLEADVMALRYEDMREALAMYQMLRSGRYANNAGMGSKMDWRPVNAEAADTSLGLRILQRISKLKAGDYSVPLEVDGQYWILQVLRAKGKTFLPEKLAAPEIEQILLREEREGKSREHLIALRSRYVVLENNLDEPL